MPVADAPDIALLRAAFDWGLERSGPLPGRAKGHLTYASSKVRVNVSLSRPHCEADVELGLVNAPDLHSQRSFAGLAPNEAWAVCEQEREELGRLLGQGVRLR
jgi:hypothetical protein